VTGAARDGRTSIAKAAKNAASKTTNATEEADQDPFPSEIRTRSTTATREAVTRLVDKAIKDWQNEHGVDFLPGGDEDQGVPPRPTFGKAIDYMIVEYLRLLKLRGEDEVTTFDAESIHAGLSPKGAPAHGGGKK